MKYYRRKNTVKIEANICAILLFIKYYNFLTMHITSIIIRDLRVHIYVAKPDCGSSVGGVK